MTSSMGRSVRRMLLAVVAGAALPALADVSLTAVPPAPLRSMSAAKAARPQMLLPQRAPAMRVVLEPPTAAELASLRQHNAASHLPGRAASQKGLAIAFPRDVPDEARTIALDALTWQAGVDGSRVAKIDVVSPGARALRVALRLPPSAAGISFRFIGNGAHAQPFGPVQGADVAADAARFGVFWSPVLDGDTATIEVRTDAPVLPGVVLTVARVSHQVVATASLDKLDAKAVEDIGTAGPCNVDVACVTPRTQAFVDSMNAVAATEMTKENGFTYLCTGTLLNDSIASNTPYFFSASHCIDSAMAARTLNTFWFFEASACGSRDTPAFIQQASGAALLARSNDWDWVLVRLNAAPPAGTHFSAWRAEPLLAGVPVTVVHHPQGDLKKSSQGQTLGYDVSLAGSSFERVLYSRGTTEPGSSGAGLLTFLASGGYYEVRGGLYMGDASCANPAGTDEYSRLDNMLPLVREYLTPASATGGPSTAVEFYNRALDHYFITISQAEIGDLDAGVHPGWERTGLRFLAYGSAVVGTSPVCRYYRTPGFGDSHFYSASPSECAAVSASPQQFPGWTLETSGAFFIALPDAVTGACGAGNVPVFRFFNQVTTNHRYTTDVAVRDDLRSKPWIWVPEGYGPDGVIMCAPVGT